VGGSKTYTRVKENLVKSADKGGSALLVAGKGISTGINSSVQTEGNIIYLIIL
jgi:hypothetical protein